MNISPVIVELDEETFLSKMEKTKDKWVVDVRKKKDYNQFHLQGALSIDIMSPNAIDGIALLRKEKPVFLYCNSGIRSKSACKIFDEMGFQKIYHLTKGINSVNNASFVEC